MASINTDVTRLIQERDTVIAERRHALMQWANAEEARKIHIHSEFIQPLNEQLLKLNRKLGI